MQQTYSSAYGKVLTVLVAAVAALSLGTAAVSGELGGAWWALPAAALACVGTWAAFWRPEVVLSRAGVTIVNPLRTVVVPWGAIEGVSTRWSLEVRTVRRAWTAWAAPRAGAGASVTRRVRRRRRGGDDGEQTGASAEVVAAAIEVWSSARDDGDVEQVRWHRATVLALVALTLATVALAL